MDLSGILVIDKPAGPTSFEVVKKIRDALGVEKVGHTGTLDPAATGVLALCLGAATKLAGYLIEGDKKYEAQIKLGEVTDTQDAQGTVLQEHEVGAFPRSRLESELQRFTGTILQVPPMYSAVKKEGKRLYQLAREGKEVERQPREVKIHGIELLNVALPLVDVRISCSKGTYVRTLAHDLGQALGCGAHLHALRRTQSGPFEISQAASLAALLEMPALASQRLISMADAFRELPTLTLDAETLKRKVSHGQPLVVPSSLKVEEGAKVRILGPDEAMVALGERRGPQVRYLRIVGA